MWNLDLGELKYTFDSSNGGHTDQVRALVSVNGLLCSGADDSKIKVIIYFH